MKYRWDKKYKYWGVTAFLVLAASITFFCLLNNLPTVSAVVGKVVSSLGGILYGLVFAYLLAPVVNKLEATCFKKLPDKIFKKKPGKGKRFTRGLSVTISVSLGVLLITLLCLLVLPQLIESIGGLATNMSSYVSVTRDWVSGIFVGTPEVQEYVVSLISEISTAFTSWAQIGLPSTIETMVSTLTGTVMAVVSTTINLFIGLIVCIYLLYHKEVFMAQAKRMVYGFFPVKWSDNILVACSHTHKKFAAFITGKIIDSIIVGVVCFIGLLIFRIPYAAMIATVVGITNVIPFFGPFIGAVPSAFILLLVDPVKCLIFCIFILVLQQIEGNIIEPKVLGSTTGMSGFWVIFSITVGGGLFGITGMVLSVPLFASLYTGLTLLNVHLLKSKGLPTYTGAYRVEGPVAHDPVPEEEEDPEEGLEEEPNQEPDDQSVIEPSEETAPRDIGRVP